MRRSSGADAARVEEKIAAALREIQPLLHGEAVLRLRHFDSARGRVVVSVSGNCPDCAMPASRFIPAIEANLCTMISEVSSVVAEETT